jgi:hypothetical protein
MAKTKLGSLVDLIVTLAGLLLLAAVVFGIYCFFNPGTWGRTVDKIVSIWDKTKSSGDRVVDDSWGKVKKSGDKLIEYVPREKQKKAPEKAPEDKEK